jgi:hypothetical protein
MVDKNLENQDLDLVEAIVAEQLAQAQENLTKVIITCSCISCSACTCGGMA